MPNQPLSPAPQALFPSLVAGLVTGVVVVVLSLSFAVLIFSGELSGQVGTAISMVLFTAVVVGAALALFSSFPGTIGFPQDKIAPILALMASLIVAAMPPEAGPGAVFSTVAGALAAASLLTGLLLFALGYFRLGVFIRFIPYPVIGGFLAGTGWLLIKGAIKVMVGHAPTLENLPELFTLSILGKWLPGLVFALALLAGMRRWRHVATLPTLLTLGILAFHGVALALGLGPEDLERLGLVLGHLPASAGWRPDALLHLASADWGVIAAQAGSLSTIMLVSAIGVLLNSSGIEVAANQDMDLDRELKIAGLANLVSGAGGGIIGFHTLGLSSMVLKMGVRSRVAGLVSALVCLAMLVAGTAPLVLFPKAVLGGLLMFIGIGFLDEWLVEGRHHVPLSDYAIILMIVAVVGTIGYLQGAAVGIVACIVLFVFNYSRVAIAKYVVTRREMASNVDRSPAQAALLQEHGERVLIYSLQGFMFFGSANTLMTRVIERCTAAGQGLVEAVIFDFRRISGMDTSAAMCFVKLLQFAEKNGLSLVFAGQSPGVRMALERAGFAGDGGDHWRAAGDLDHALEWSEDHLLARLEHDGGDDARTLAETLGQDMGDPALAARALSYFEPLDLPPGAVLMEQDSPARDLFILESGRLTVQVRSADGLVLRLRTLQPGNVIGEMGLYLHERRSASVVADEACAVLRLSAGDLSAMEERDPGAAAAFHRLMAHQLAGRVRNSVQIIKALVD